MADAVEPPSTTDPNAVYSLGSSASESSRLLRQADELLAANTTLLDRAPLGGGEAAIDLGCGPRGILEVLSKRVGTSGRVVGVDADPCHVAMAAEMVAARKLDNVEVLLGDARDTRLPSSSFDVVHARTLLINVPQPSEVVEDMATLPMNGWSACSPPRSHATGPIGESGVGWLSCTGRQDSSMFRWRREPTHTRAGIRAGQ